MVPKVIEAGVSVVENAVGVRAEMEQMEEMAAMMEVAHRLGTRLATAHSPSWH